MSFKSNNKVNLAVIGCGNIARFHIPAMRTLLHYPTLFIPKQSPAQLSQHRIVKRALKLKLGRGKRLSASWR